MLLCNTNLETSWGNHSSTQRPFKATLTREPPGEEAIPNLCGFWDTATGNRKWLYFLIYRKNQEIFCSVLSKTIPVPSPALITSQNASWDLIKDSVTRQTINRCYNHILLSSFKTSFSKQRGQALLGKMLGCQLGAICPGSALLPVFEMVVLRSDPLCCRPVCCCLSEMSRSARTGPRAPQASFWYKTSRAWGCGTEAIPAPRTVDETHLSMCAEGDGRAWKLVLLCRIKAPSVRSQVSLLSRAPGNAHDAVGKSLPEWNGLQFIF